MPILNPLSRISLLFRKNILLKNNSENIIKKRDKPQKNSFSSCRGFRSPYFVGMAAPGFVIPLESVKRFSLEEYHRLGQSGVLPRDTELLEGILVNKMTLSPRHRLVVNKFRHILEKLLPASFVILQEGPLTIGDSEPEPDLSILEGSYDDFASAHPTTAAWVIEVAVSSFALDRSKSALYARAEIPDYWILDLDRNRVIVFSRPVQGVYARESVLTAADRIPLPVAPNHGIALVDLG